MTIGKDVAMFYNAKPLIFERAKVLRNNMTPSEKAIWEILKGKKMLSLRFRPQHPMFLFIADFYCHPLKLVLEIDGDIHKSAEQKEYDIGREEELKHWEIKVIRFNNEEVQNDIELVKNKIKKICINRIRELKKSPLGDLGVNFLIS